MSPAEPIAVTDPPPTLLTPEHLEQLSLFRSVDPGVVLPLLAGCSFREVAAGETVIGRGERNEAVYVLLEGRLRIRLPHSADDAVSPVEPGESVGELSVIDGRPSSADVVAETPARLLALDEQVLWMLVESSHTFAANVLALLGRRLRSSNAMISRIGQRLDSYRIHATVDALTGLFNRHWLDAMLPRLVERAHRSGEPLSALLTDLDDFKLYNDTHGHLAGDFALRAAADCLRRELRPTDMAARYGGEEFLVLLPATDLAAARAAGERLRSAVETATVSAPGDPNLPRVTVSIGLGALAPDAGPLALVEAADKALYRAKAAGRNRVCT